MTSDPVTHYYSASVSKTIGTVHLTLGVMAIAVYLSAFLTSNTLPFVSLGSFAVLLFFISGFLQRLMRLTVQRTIWLIAAADVLLFTLVIWSFASLYGGLSAAALKSPSYAFVFALIALQALRQSHRLILFLGGVAIGARLVTFVTATSSGADTTTSYTWYQKSPSLMYSGEGELLIALLLFTVFLASAVKGAVSRRDTSSVVSAAGKTTLPTKGALKENTNRPARNTDQPQEALLQSLTRGGVVAGDEHNAAENQPLEQAREPDPQVMRVLVAEDSQVNMMVIEKFLAPPEFELHMAEDGQDAISLFKNLHEQGTPPDVVLLDIEMPYMTGHEVAREIRKYEAERELPSRPIVAVTALSDDSSIEESKNAGMNDHLVKPVKKDILLASISRALALSARKLS